MIDRILEFYRRRFWKPEKYARFHGVRVGNGCKIASRYFGSEPYLISIGNHVQVTAGVRFFTHGGAWVFRRKHPNFDFFGKIVVGDNVYIGNCALILPGITVGNNVIIGAGAVVTKSIPDGKIVGGNPGRIIGDVSDLGAKMARYNVGTKAMMSREKQQYLLRLADDKFVRK